MFYKYNIKLNLCLKTKNNFGDLKQLKTLDKIQKEFTLINNSKDYYNVVEKIQKWNKVNNCARLFVTFFEEEKCENCINLVEAITLVTTREIYELYI